MSRLSCTFCLFWPPGLYSYGRVVNVLRLAWQCDYDPCKIERSRGSSKEPPKELTRGFYFIRSCGAYTTFDTRHEAGAVPRDALRGVAPEPVEHD